MKKRVTVGTKPRRPKEWIVTVAITLTDPNGGTERRRIEIQTRASERKCSKLFDYVSEATSL